MTDALLWLCGRTNKNADQQSLVRMNPATGRVVRNAKRLSTRHVRAWRFESGPEPLLGTGSEGARPLASPPRSGLACWLGSPKINGVKSASAFVLVLLTAPDLKTARALGRSAVRSHLAACANLIPHVESHYWWRGRLESSQEVLLILKTTRARLPALEKLVLAAHPYDTPEMLAVPLRAGTTRYLAWLSASCRAASPRRTRRDRGKPR